MVKVVRLLDSVYVFATTTVLTDSLGEVPIDILPDDALLQIFFCYQADAFDLSWWKPLVHVCHRWRYIIFASPLHLRLVLVRTHSTPAKRCHTVFWPNDHGPIELLQQLSIWI